VQRPPTRSARAKPLAGRKLEQPKRKRKWTRVSTCLPGLCVRARNSLDDMLTLACKSASNNTSLVPCAGERSRGATYAVVHTRLACRRQDGPQTRRMLSRSTSLRFMYGSTASTDYFKQKCVWVPMGAMAIHSLAPQRAGRDWSNSAHL
jgi:hypothetical protein